MQKYTSVFFCLFFLVVINYTKGQCTIKIEEKSDSTMYIESHMFEGVLFTKNSSFGIMTDINGKEYNINVLNFVEIPDSAQFWTPSIQQICIFETRFENWWRNGKTSTKKRQHKIATEFEQIDQLLRQYIGYKINQKKKIRVAFFVPGVLNTIPRWKYSPVVFDGGWPVYFAVRYDVDTGTIKSESLN